jgi:hypothetical protein
MIVGRGRCAAAFSALQDGPTDTAPKPERWGLDMFAGEVRAESAACAGAHTERSCHLQPAPLHPKISYASVRPTQPYRSFPWL